MGSEWIVKTLRISANIGCGFEGDSKDAKGILDYIAALESENERLKEDRRWIPVSERLPEANKCVLIYDAGGNMTVDILVKSGGVETYFWLPKYRILFWMPIPEPPEVK